MQVNPLASLSSSNSDSVEIDLDDSLSGNEILSVFQKVLGSDKKLLDNKIEFQKERIHQIHNASSTSFVLSLIPGGVGSVLHYLESIGRNYTGNPLPAYIIALTVACASGVGLITEQFFKHDLTKLLKFKKLFEELNDFMELYRCILFERDVKNFESKLVFLFQRFEKFVEALDATKPKDWVLKEDYEQMTTVGKLLLMNQIVIMISERDLFPEICREWDETLAFHLSQETLVENQNIWKRLNLVDLEKDVYMKFYELSDNILFQPFDEFFVELIRVNWDKHKENIFNQDHNQYVTI